MPSYLITGVSRGIGFEFLTQLSENPENNIVGLVRDKKTTNDKIARELGQRKNVHILQADLVNYDELKASVEKTAQLTNGALDYIIANGAFVSPWSGYATLTSLGKTPQDLEKDMVDAFRINVVGNVHLFNLYLPLILKGQAKKVIAISTGMADLELITGYDVAIAAPYSISKAALNVAIAKYSAEYKKDGVLFLAISPGLVDTQGDVELKPEELQAVMDMSGKFATYAPNFTGPITPKASVENVLAVVNKASIETGYGGGFVSHYGNKQWL